MSGSAKDWRARLRLDPTAFIAPGAVVIGDVQLGPRSSIWFNTVVRGDTDAVSIGAETNIQDNSTVHVDAGQPAVIGARVTVGHRAIVHGCVIEDECLIGMGSVVLSGARIGAGSLLGAASLVREGQVIPPGSLAMGAPARVVGAVTAAHREAIQRGTAHYVELSGSYLARGFARPHSWPGSDTGVSGPGRGPLMHLEWGQLLSALSEGPDWMEERITRHGVTAWRRAPGPGAWSALEVLCHLRDTEREVYLPRLVRLLEEHEPAIEDLDVATWAEARRYRDQELRPAFDSWREARLALLARLAPLGRPEWRRLGYHSVRGPFALGEMVREWVDHELAHRWQIARALGERA